jgi:hypothetical protein
MKIPQINKKYNSLAKNYCNRKIALLSILIQLNLFVTKKRKVFWTPDPKILVTTLFKRYIDFIYLFIYFFFFVN